MIKYEELKSGIKYFLKAMWVKSNLKIDVNRVAPYLIYWLQ